MSIQSILSCVNDYQKQPTEVFYIKRWNFLEISQNSQEGLIFNTVAGLRPETSNFIKKETLAQVFSCEFCEMSKNTFLTEHHWTTASRLWSIFRGNFDTECISLNKFPFSESSYPRFHFCEYEIQELIDSWTLIIHEHDNRIVISIWKMEIHY